MFLLYPVQLKYLGTNNKLLFERRLLNAFHKKAESIEKRSRQSDVMSDLEKMNVMLGNSPENQSDVDLNENVEVDSRSNGTRTDMVRNCEDFRTLLTSEDRNRCGTTMETNRLISEEISYQMNRKMDELKRNLDTQITESINSAIHDSILPSIQNSLSGQNSGLGTNVDSRSSRLSRNTEGKSTKVPGKILKIEYSQI